MDLFTYLMAKNGNNSSVHGDLFSYLLGKGQSQTYTVSGVTIYIPNAKKLVSFMMTKESTQYTTTGKNKMDFTKTSVTLNNVDYECNNTYQMKINGTATNNGTAQCNNSITLKPGNYVFQISFESGNIISNNINTEFILRNTTTDTNVVAINVTDTNNKSVAFTLTEETIIRPRIYVRTNVSFSNAVINLNVIEGSTPDYVFEPYTGGIPSPSPEFPQSVKTVKGIVNLYDKTTNSINNTSNTRLQTSGYIALPAGTYTISYTGNINQLYIMYYDSNHTKIGETNWTSGNVTFTYNQDYEYKFTFRKSGDANIIPSDIDNIQIVEGDQQLPYVPYGNNYVNVAVNDGTNTNNYPIPLNNNELVGIGDYKDELKVDKSGHVWLNKKIFKRILNGTENWYIDSSNGKSWFALSNGDDTFYWIYQLISVSRLGYVKTNIGITPFSSIVDGTKYGIGLAYSYRVNIQQVDANNGGTVEQFKEWLINNNIIVYIVRKESAYDLIDLNTTVDLKLFKGVNNVSNSEDGYMTIEYR